jgi:hypothetical protein
MALRSVKYLRVSFVFNECLYSSLRFMVSLYCFAEERERLLREYTEGSAIVKKELELRYVLFIFL